MNSKDSEYIRKLVEGFHFKQVHDDLWQCGEFFIERKEEPVKSLKKVMTERFYLSQQVCIPSMDRDEPDYWDAIEMGSFPSLRDAMRKAFIESVSQVFRANDQDDDFIESMRDVFSKAGK